MQNSFGNFHASGNVSFTDNSRTFHGVVLDAEDLVALQTRARVVVRQVDTALPQLEPELACTIRSATDDVTAELAEAAPDRGRLGTALRRIAALASGVTAAAGIVESVESMVSVLGGS